MLRGPATPVVAVIFAFAFALGACKPTPKKTGPLVAKGQGIAITADEFKARLDEQSPFLRARYASLDRKKEFLDNLVRFELLSNQAQKQGLDKDPEVQNTLKKIMVQRLVQRSFQEGDPAKDIAEADARKFYDEHRDDYLKPKRLRLAQILVAAPVEGPERAVKAARAKKLLAQVKAEEKKNSLAFATLAREASDDTATKPGGGDLGFRSREEMETQHGKAFADGAFALKDGEEAVLESPQGFHVVKVTGRQEELNRTFEQVRAQIQSRLYRDKRSKDFEDYVKRLREEARVTVDEAALEKVAVAAGAPGGPTVVPGPAAPPHPVAPAPPQK
jgi:peptidyl-prolyl cis-trans isomerase C